MPFPYYRRLSAARKRIYRRSDEITATPLPRAQELRPLTAELAAALEEEDRRGAEKICQHLADGLTERLEVPPVQVLVLRVRPRDGWGELHGLYEPSEDDYRSRISLWMRTAQRAQIVAFRTFLRTLLHELGHHLDYELFELEETFHTEGFYKRESSLFNQLVDKEKPGR
ncbi:MAG: hypothetical protein WBH75_07180 [Thermoanaerobaculia bacterium]